VVRISPGPSALGAARQQRPGEHIAQPLLVLLVAPARLKHEAVVSLSRLGRVELGLFLVLFSLMIGMRFGY
jgi:hypothetical protein